MSFFLRLKGNNVDTSIKTSFFAEHSLLRVLYLFQFYYHILLSTEWHVLLSFFFFEIFILLKVIFFFTYRAIQMSLKEWDKKLFDKDDYKNI